MQVMRIEPSEYEHLRSWFSFMVPKAFSSHEISPPNDPVAVLDWIAAKTPAKARSGLGMAIADIIESVSHWSASEVATCNRDLLEMGLPTLSEVQARCSKLVQRVVRRGQIKSDIEYYTLRNAVEHAGDHAATLWPLLQAYECRK